MFESLAFKAFLFGIISAASLPLGTLTTLVWKPRDRTIAFLMAFGGGALIAALTIDLVAVALEAGHFYSLVTGCVLGGILFVLLNQVVNNKGGFLRKASTSIAYLRRIKSRRLEKTLERMSQVEFFADLPPEEAQALIPLLNTRRYPAGSTILRQGEPGDSLFVIEEGDVDIIDIRNNLKLIATLHTNDVFGEMALVTGQPRSATAVTTSETRLWVILKDDFDSLIGHSPKLAHFLKELVSSRISDLKKKKTIPAKQASEWVRDAMKNLDEIATLPTESEIRQEASKHSGAPLAIWLGILLDGIPESLVIGASLLHSTVSISLIAGLFLSNYPEALSSSVGMAENGYSFRKTFGMWSSLMIITGMGALLGNIFFVGAPEFLFSLVEGMAAGAMLTMVAETMLPEAYYKGGAITGFSTLLGFLAVITVRTLG